MEKVNRILSHPAFQGVMAELTRLEQQRIFCRHGMEHLLEVARLAHIYNLEEGAGVSPELLYAAALLHDIGRAEQYRSGTPHDEAGIPLAQSILTDCGFSEEEREEILTAISRHRRGGEGESALADLLYRADKRSRPCYACPARSQCNWPAEKQNLKLMR